MSEFDKEAERERLREQYEAERADREATQRMSELLLQGATMTNRHCDECGDPIFRYEGREFCVTCEAEGRTGNGEAAESATAEPTETEAASTDAEAADQPESSAPEPADDAADEPTEVASPEPASEPSASSPSTQTTDSGEPTASGQPAVSPTSGDGDLEAARAAMVRTVTDLARRAEETGDVGRKRTLLKAVREAAEALDAIEVAGR